MKARPLDYKCVNLPLPMKVVAFFITAISRLPLSVLYLCSDILFLVNYYLIGYRRKVVRSNLTAAFPTKTKSEIQDLEKEFFRNFSDYLVETIKSFTISKEELNVRMQHLNRHHFDEAKKEGKNVIILAGHVFNWEWVSALGLLIKQEHSYPVYRRVKNSFWNTQVVKMRNRFANQSVEAQEVVRHILSNPNDGNSIYMFVADQSPHFTQVISGLTFLNQPTPVFMGYDKLASRMDLAFIYCDMKKVKRGFYQVNYTRIEPEQTRFVPGEIVVKFHQLLQHTITQRPANYLWSHRRWKYSAHIKTML